MASSGARAVGAVLAIPKVVTGGLVLLAIGVMLYGVFMRYVMLPITDWLDVDPINFFWVEEVGETTLCLAHPDRRRGRRRRAQPLHADLLTHRFPPRARHVIHVFNNLLIAAFGGLIAWLGVQLAMLNAMLTSPALEFSLAWLYAAAVGRRHPDRCSTRCVPPPIRPAPTTTSWT